MRTILTIIQKEFIQIKRDKTMLPIIFVVPIVQLLFLVYAATFDIRNIDICVVDNDLSITSRQIVEKFDASKFFTVKYRTLSLNQAQDLLKKGKVDLIINIPPDFEKNLIKNNYAQIQLLIDAINQVVASVANSYCQNIIRSYNKNIITRFADAQTLKPLSQLKTISIDYRFWYNPQLNYKTFMVPGILSILITIIGMFLTAMNIVKEKEIGTIEQINVTPIKKHQFIIGKIIPFLIIGLAELSFGLFLGKILFDVPIVGSLFVLFFAATIYLFLILGFGLLISTLTDTQQQAMFIAWFFMLIFLLMSGLFTPIESMPDWAQKIDYLNPTAYFIRIIRMVLLKGSGITDITKELVIMTIYGIAVFTLSTIRYRKTN